MNCLLVLSLAVLGASAAPCGLNYNTISGGVVASQVGLNEFNGLNGFGAGSVCGGCASALPGRTLYGQTQVIENPTAVFPSVIPPTSVSQSCHCMKTIVRPQIRTEVITVPQIDRVVRVVPSPVVEAVSINVGGNTRNSQIPTCGINTGVVGGIVDGVSGVSGISGVSGVISGAYPGVVSGTGCGGVISSGIVGNVGCGVINSGIVGNVGCGSNIVV